MPLSLPAARRYYRSRLELITETAPIASRLPEWMLPTNNKKSIKKSITDALDEAKKDKSDDPNRINYLINRVDAAVRYGTQQTDRTIGAMETRTERSIETRFAALETKLAATSKELSKTQQKLDKMMVLLERVAAKVKA